MVIENKKHVLRELQFEITHKCNKMCSFCDHRIQHNSKYRGFTKEDYRYILDCILDKAKINKIWLGGGEPLMHPEINWFIRQMKIDFPNAGIDLVTNGSLIKKNLHQISFENLNNLIISYYPGWNDDIVREYRRLQHVVIWDRTNTWDPYIDPDLSEDDAKWWRQKCLYQVRLIGTNMYGCCVSEGVERYYETESVHTKFSMNWQEDFFNLPTWKACQHCFRAHRKEKSDENSIDRAFGNGW